VPDGSTLDPSGATVLAAAEGLAPGPALTIESPPGTEAAVVDAETVAVPSTTRRGTGVARSVSVAVAVAVAPRDVVWNAVPVLTIATRLVPGSCLTTMTGVAVETTDLGITDVDTADVEVIGDVETAMGTAVVVLGSVIVESIGVTDGGVAVKVCPG
jgi:hypothetical protein